MTNNTYKSIGIAGIAALAIIAISCSTAKISVNKAELVKVKSIAVVDFETEPGIPSVIADECEEAFRGHFVEVGKTWLSAEAQRDFKGDRALPVGIVENSRR